MEGGFAADQDEAVSAKSTETPTDTTVYFDITDLLTFLKTSPVVSGIQRVQVEAILALQDEKEATGTNKCAVFGPDFVWRSVPVKEFCRLFAMTDLPDAKWQAKLSSFTKAIMSVEPLQFAPGDTLYFLGASWGIPGLFESLRHERCEGVRYIFYLHDMIPVKFPEYFIPQIETEFSYWVFNVSNIAAAVICNSQATRDDFLAITGFEGPTGVVNLNIKPNFASTEIKSVKTDVLAEHGLSPQGYVLMVGTLEPRKNHIAITNVWIDLMRRFGEQCPKLVIVGRIGWSADGICQHIDLMNRSNGILHLEDLRDFELAQLYRQCCFTVYASRYEGWGLPVTESLAFGKVCASSDNSSLPEAGQGLTVLMDHRSEKDICEKLSDLIGNPDKVRKLEKRIQSAVKFTTWQEFGRQVRAIEKDLPGTIESSVPSIDPDVSYWFGRDKWANAFAGTTPGEVLRTGSGWRPVEGWGSWCNARKSGVLFSLSESGDFDCYFLVVAPPSGACFRLTCGDNILWEGKVVKQKLIWGRLGSLSAGEPVRLEIQCDELAAEPSRWLRPPAGPTIGAGWIAMRLQRIEDEGSREDKTRMTLAVLQEFLQPRQTD